MKIVVLGTATLDIVLKTDQELKKGEKIEINKVYISLGGGALNAATTFKKLDLDYLAYFRLTKDLIGNLILRKIMKEKIKSRIFFHKGGSQFSIVVLIPNSERTIFVYRGASSHFSLRELKSLPKEDYYYLTTGETSPEIFLKFLKKIKTTSKLISLNPSKIFLSHKKAKDCLKLIDVLFLNKNEASFFLKRYLSPLELIKELGKTLGIKVIVVTLGKEGSLTLFNNKIFQAGVFKPKKIEDTTGAGDAFASSFFANLVMAKEINDDVVKKSILFGSANASANIEKLGAQIGILAKKDYQRYFSKRIHFKIWKN